MSQNSKSHYLVQPISNIMKKYHLAGNVLVLNGDQDNSAMTGFGDANHRQHLSNANENILYPSASLQKAMTATMMIQLMNESKKTNHPIDEHSTIQQWFPSLNRGNKITISQLLTHTSGIVDFHSERNPGYLMTENEAIQDTIKRINSKKFSLPTFYYDNDNYILLAGIIRALTHRSYAQNIQERIIKPLGLKHTYMWHAIPPQFTIATSYRSWWRWSYLHPKKPNNNLMSYILGAGNLYTTPMDYLIFQRGLHNGKLLNITDYARLTNQPDQPKNGYSGGMYHQHHGQVKKVYGYLRGTNYRNWIQLSKDNHTGIIMFTNQSNSSNAVKSAANEILNLFLND